MSAKPVSPEEVKRRLKAYEKHGRNAALAVLKVLERKAKMMGADLPSPKDAAPPGAGTDAPLTPEQEKAAMDHFLRRIAQRNAAGTAVDVTSKPVTPEKDDK